MAEYRPRDLTRSGDLGSVDWSTFVDNYQLHTEWLSAGTRGVRLDLSRVRVPSDNLFSAKATLCHKILTKARFHLCSFEGMRLERVIFKQAYINECDFRGCVFYECDLAGAEVYDSDFSDADLTEARFGDTEVDSRYLQVRCLGGYQVAITSTHVHVGCVRLARADMPSLQVPPREAVWSAVDPEAYGWIRRHGSALSSLMARVPENKRPRTEDVKAVIGAMSGISDAAAEVREKIDELRRSAARYAAAGIGPRGREEGDMIEGALRIESRLEAELLSSLRRFGPATGLWLRSKGLPLGVWGACTDADADAALEALHVRGCVVEVLGAPPGRPEPARRVYSITTRALPVLEAWWARWAQERSAKLSADVAVAVRRRVYARIDAERAHQDEKWQGRTCVEEADETALPVLVEEVGEVAQAMLEGGDIQGELVQVAAVVVAWLERLEAEDLG